jgi:hypothetical protein
MPADAGLEKLKSEPAFVSAWLEAIESTETEEKDWTDSAKKAIDAYRGAKTSRSRQFNIHHSNVETLVPALYNSTPVPDVRRRLQRRRQGGKSRRRS